MKKPENMSFDTWHTDFSLASWDFELGVGGIRQQGHWKQKLLCQRFLEVICALNKFASVRRWSIMTDSQGDDTKIVGTVEKSEVERVLFKYDDIKLVEFDLDLKCIDLNGVDTVVENGGLLRLWMENENLRGSDTPLWLSFDLHVDLYAPVTCGEIRDNSAMAKLNGPRLTELFKRFCSEAHGKFMEVEVSRSASLADHTGFLWPTEE